MADTVAQEAAVVVAAVFTEAQALCSQKGMRRGARAFEQRAHDTAAVHGNAAKAVEAATTQQAQHDGLGLVVTRMCSSDTRRTERGRDLRQGGIPLQPGSLLEVGASGGQPRLVYDTGNSELGGHRGGMCGIAPRFVAAQAVVDVRRAHPNAELTGQHHQRRQQGDRVGPARNRHHDMLPTRHQFVAAHRGADLIEEIDVAVALHGVGHSDIITRSKQMLRCDSLRFLAGLALCRVLFSPALLLAADAPAVTEGESELDRNHAQILRTLRQLEKKYGRDAVLLEGYALGLAVRSGAILEAEANLPGYVEHRGRRFLEVRIATGIVFNDHEHTALQRPMRLWTNIVDPALSQFETIDVGADGVLFHFTYAHKAYKDERELREHLRHATRDEQTAQFYVLTSDLNERLAKRISSQQLVDRATVLVDGNEARLNLEPTPPPQRLEPPSEL